MACLLWENTFYESGVEIAERIRSLANDVDPEVVAALAIEAREKMHLRHAPLWLVCALLRPSPRGISGDAAASCVARVIQRADEIGELLAMYKQMYARPDRRRGCVLAAPLKRGIAEAFAKFDEYQLAKYNRKDREWRLRDAAFMCHPTRTELTDRLTHDSMETPETWEVGLSAAKSPDEKRAVWERLLEEGKLGGLAFIRNLRNMADVGVNDAAILRAFAEIKWRRILPFRFLAAAKHAPRWEPQLDAAMLSACADMTKLSGRTVILIDTSGSMDGNLSAKSDINRIEAAGALAVLCREVCDDARVVVFSRTVMEIAARRGLPLIDAVMKHERNATHLGAAIRFCDGIGGDRIIIVTDEQSHDQVSSPKFPRSYCCNVAAYNNGVGYGGKWSAHIDGFSENVVRWIAEFEAQGDSQ